ncbi:glucose 1-dehydrogenase [bacterium]|nr:MAG: glucose 1-dehydrogenase [bacterium]
MSKRLEGKVALVTGASKGIGAGIAKSLAADGAKVVVNFASSREGADRVVSEIVAAGGEAVAVHADVSSEADLDRLFAETKSAYGRLDFLVNNAGIFSFGALADIEKVAFNRMFDINVLGLLLASQKAAAAFDERGGSILNISSGVVKQNPAMGSVYTASKAAVDAISATLAKELGPRGIRVNSLSPGMVETEGVHTAGFLGTDFERGMIAQTPLGRIGQPDDISTVAAFLASDDAKWVTGQVLQVNGGAL